MSMKYTDTCYIDIEDVVYMAKYAIAHSKSCEVVIGNARCYSGICSRSKRTRCGSYSGKYIVDLEYTYYDDRDKCSYRTSFSCPSPTLSMGGITDNTFSYYYEEPVNIFTRSMLKELGILIDNYINTSLSDDIKSKIKDTWKKKEDVAYGFTMKDYKKKIDYTYKSDIELLEKVEWNFGREVYEFKRDIIKITLNLLIKNNIDINRLIKPKEILFPPVGYKYNPNNYIDVNIYKLK